MPIARRQFIAGLAGLLASTTIGRAPSPMPIKPEQEVLLGEFTWSDGLIGEWESLPFAPVFQLAHQAAPDVAIHFGPCPPNPLNLLRYPLPARWVPLAIDQPTRVTFGARPVSQSLTGALETV